MKLVLEAGPGYLFQEAETKDKTAMAGEKAGRNEKAKLEGPTTPEGTRSYAAAVKNEKERRNHKAGVCEVRQR